MKNTDDSLKITPSRRAICNRCATKTNRPNNLINRKTRLSHFAKNGSALGWSHRLDIRKRGWSCNLFCDFEHFVVKNTRMRLGIIRRALKPIIKIMPILQRTAHEIQDHTWIAKPKSVITIRICSIARPAICIDSGNTRLNWVHMDVVSERNCLHIISTGMFLNRSWNK